MSLLPNARFCHDCGGQVQTLATTTCEACDKTNPLQAKFCLSCGHQLGQTASTSQPNETQPTQQRTRFRLDFQDWTTFPTQIKKHFLSFLADMLLLDGEEKKLSAYMAAFEQTGFRATLFEEAALQLTAYAEAFVQAQPMTAIYDIDALLVQRFELAYLEFITGYAHQITPASLSKQILSHEKAKKINIAALINDYLDLQNERGITAYRAMTEIPLPKLKNAQISFFHGTRAGEFPLVFIDQTIWGSGNDGLILSEYGIYWKTAFHSAAKIAYADLQTIVRKDRYLEVNGIYLNVSARLNYKLCKLLQKLQRLAH
jgi:hypothetical protein